MPDVIDWTPKARAVLEAAAELFYAHGIHAVGVDVIAEHAGVTKKTLYDRFGSKERLVVEYLAERDRQWWAFLDRYLERTRPDSVARVAAVFEAAARWACERGRKGCAMINAHAEIGDPEHPAYAVLTGQKRRMLALFTELATRAGADEPESAGAHIMLLHEGALVCAGMHSLEDAFTRAGKVAVDLLR
ncbi:TetR/AcrR family transcriptional regulator [Sciscionella sediminilitoris]|uniref:TetR/AcrR family transcriptional regulator n=1 Tax=Sciscionella sediminilitoris TaxID=1445613 RepID=UPI0004DF9C68|nr:TetR/AcrR family transcriptional regulator [Sciscionella sp. SE31]